MSDSTPRLGLPDLPDTPELYADTVSDAFAQIDAFTDLYLKGQFIDTPPGSPADGDAYLTGGAPTGAWSGYAYKIASCLDGGWRFYTPFDGLRAFVATTNAFIVYVDGAWIDWNALISAAEVSIASAATCDLGAAGSLFLQVTGATTITSFGTSANTLRYVRFAGALTLTYNATSLILPGGASIVTAAGDTALFASDGSGNWRCQYYQPAAVTGTGADVRAASPAFTGTVTAAAANVSGNLLAGGTSNGRSARVLSENAAGQQLALRYSGIATWYANVDASGNLFWDKDGSENLRFGSDGSFLVGTTVNGGWIGNAKLAVEGSANTTGSVYSSASTGRAFIVRVDNTSVELVDFNYNGTGVGSITTNGTTTTYGTTSDARLKNVAPRQRDYRDAIRALWVGDFTWKDGGAPGFGVLAQQAYEVMPNHQGVTKPADDAAAWVALAEPFAHLALWGVKDLYAMIETLAARVAAMLEAAHDAG